MGRPAIEMIGKTFGEWKVLERAPHLKAPPARINIAIKKCVLAKANAQCLLTSPF